MRGLLAAMLGIVLLPVSLLSGLAVFGGSLMFLYGLVVVLFFGSALSFMPIYGLVIAFIGLLGFYLKGWLLGFIAGPG